MASRVIPRLQGARAKGENAELRADLNSQYRDSRKEAIKRVIASMTGETPERRALSPPLNQADTFTSSTQLLSLTKNFALYP